MRGAIATTGVTWKITAIGYRDNSISFDCENNIARDIAKNDAIENAMIVILRVTKAEEKRSL